MSEKDGEDEMYEAITELVDITWTGTRNIEPVHEKLSVVVLENYPGHVTDRNRIDILEGTKL